MFKVLLNLSCLEHIRKEIFLLQEMLRKYRKLLDIDKKNNFENNTFL